MTPAGFRLYPGLLDEAAQQALTREVFAAPDAPFYRSKTPSGKPMSVEMTNFGPLGWVTDARGYRYQPSHPTTGRPWPPMPSLLRDLWRNLAGTDVEADCCLANLYRAGARMGLHQDRDEADFGFPVISVSLGDTAVFRIGGAARRGAAHSVRLASGDVCALSGEARLAFHGVDRILEGTSRLIPGGGRLSLTLRRANPGAAGLRP
jgi:alkylated DNA repair protein (DNA oxidative demethylase)